MPDPGAALSPPMTIVTIATGSLLGTLDHDIHSFKGIPFAEAVGGEDRWLPPTPRRPWNGVRDARAYGDACTQFGAKNVGPFPRARRAYLDAIRDPMQQGDDCLVLNVWTPTVDRGARLPVMVYIHGGGLTQGAAAPIYDATPFARKDVVAVVIQYRLGPLGFLHGSGLFDGELCADNRGFLDQLAALRWVQENIGAFGGDAGNVTIFGESAGAFAVYQLCASPMSRGLFRRAIAMGGMTETYAAAEEYHALTRDVLADVGVKPGDARALITLDRARLEAMSTSIRNRIFGRKAPADRYGSLSRRKVGFVGAAAGTEFLPRPPLSCLRSGTPNDVDLMLGTCAHDGRLFSLGLPVPMAWNAWLFAPAFAGIMPNGDLQAARRHYKAAMAQGLCERATAGEQLNNDAFFRMPTIAAAEAHAAGHPGRTFLFQVDYASAVPGLGAIHGIEVALLFQGGNSRTLLHDDAKTRALSEMMVSAWTSFARSGRPVAPGLPFWSAFDDHRRGTLVFDRQSRLESDWGGRLRSFWAGPTA